MGAGPAEISFRATTTRDAPPVALSRGKTRGENPGTDGMFPHSAVPAGLVLRFLPTQGVRPKLNCVAAPRLEWGGAGAPIHSNRGPSQKRTGGWPSLSAQHFLRATMEWVPRPCDFCKGGFGCCLHQETWGTDAPEVSSVVPPGLVPFSPAYPGLTPWAKLCRRSAARTGWGWRVDSFQ